MVKGRFPRPATLTLQTTQPAHLPKTIAAIPPLQMLSTGVVMRRLYVLHGTPIGFWPQLISHFYTERIFSNIVKEAIKRTLQHGVDPGDSFASKWRYHKHSIELVTNNVTILTIGSVGRDYMDMKQTSHRSEINLASFHFYNDQGELKESDFKFYSGVLIEVNDFVFVSSNSERVINCTPDMCQHSAELLTFAVEMLDCLLSEVFHRTRMYDDSSWLKELIPCPFCLEDERVGEADYPSSDGYGYGEQEAAHSQEPCYFTINYCLTKIKTNQRLQCPKHGGLEMESLAPDLVCIAYILFSVWLVSAMYVDLSRYVAQDLFAYFIQSAL